MVGTQQFVWSVILHHSDFQAVQVLQCAGLLAAFMGQDDDGEIQIRARESQVALAFGG
ncbi:hypothetical protein D3C81_1330370 [compost metagenome]